MLCHDARLGVMECHDMSWSAVTEINVDHCMRAIGSSVVPPASFCDVSAFHPTFSGVLGAASARTPSSLSCADAILLE